MVQSKKTAISLFSGAGGMDVGFQNAGFQIRWANDFDKDACSTYEANFGSHVVHGDINELLPLLADHKHVDCLFGGPPCQGFSVAGNMDPNDERSKLVMSYMDAVKIVQPSVFVMENVKALGTLAKFQAVREELYKRAQEMGYQTELLILNSKDYGVPQSRERMFLVGFKEKTFSGTLASYLSHFQTESKTVREIIAPLGPAGTAGNNKTVNAKISIAKSPVLRKSPYAGMLFNGQGRPLNPDAYSSTLHASMGGNRTPIIDEEQLYNNAVAWVEEYHQHLMSGGKPYDTDAAPKRLRRMTVDEAHLLQTFPEDFKFMGKQSSVFRQIGNAVPCKLAEAVASLACAIIDGSLQSPQVLHEENLELPLAV
ncbi:DNA cytosine methyltransferase [Vibrio cholerae]|uniref:DNA cytosine methyltransferase n=1 Tax=Vibrio cholerae TaxID=666 RepID=UPI0028D9FEF4|nr:DNA cytosine methyltransferase [Vibrio cholerae]ELJ8720573.1 DNA cytosine methyltransferase [Vibrio cholerae]MDV2354582.1 DNA cytosine methyltransferase [Vibrio cholerae]